MGERNDDPTSDEAAANDENAGRLSRRRWLQLTAAGIAGGAAAAGTAGADESDHPHTIIFDGTVSHAMAKYEFEVSESVEPHGDVGALEVRDSIDGTSVSGAVHRDVDAYRFSGSLTHLNVEGAADVSVDYGDDGGVGTDRLQVVASGSDSVEYTFTTGDRIEPVTDHDDYPANDGDEAEENDDGTWTATGRTGDGSGDTFDFWGDVEAFEPRSGEFTLLLNGEEVTPWELTGQRKTRRLEIVAEDHVEYRFTASSEIEMVLDNGANSSEPQWNDGVSENGDGTWTAEGLTGNGEGDTFDFAGEATGFEILEGDCTLYLDGVEVTIAELVGEEPPDDGANVDHRLEIVAEDPLDYVFSTSGEMSKVLDNGDNSSEEVNDAITENDDGTCTAEGHTGLGYGDTYDFVGEATEFEPKTGNFTLYLDGEEVTPYELVGEEPPAHKLEIVRREDDYIDYTFTTTGEITMDLDNGDRSAEEDRDTVLENDDGTWTVEGVTGDGYGDSYDFVGEATDFEPKDGQFALYLDDERLTAYELVGEEPPQDGGSSDPVDGGPIGGGDGYPNTVSPDDADVTVSTKRELLDALSSASSGDVVYVAGNASIDMGSTDFNVPDGVTLASNRGIDGAPGGHLHTDEKTRSIHLGRNSRITGLRVQGPFYEFFSTSDWVGGVGVRATKPGAEIDNNEIWGFAYAAINGLRNDEHVHHNHLHHNPRDGVGYGIECSNGHPLIEWNRFNANRHSVASSGNGGYTVRYNYIDEDILGACIDAHRPGGTRMEVYRNTVKGYIDAWDSSREVPAYQIRGVPDDVAEIRDNWFYNPNRPRDNPGGWTNEAIIQVHVDDWTNVEWENNHYGSSEPSKDVGAPR